MLYRPKLPNGKIVPLDWPVAVYRWVNIICWPLESNAGLLARIFDRFCWTLTFLIFVQHNEAEVRYLYNNLQNLDEMLAGMPTYLILLEVHLRAFPLGIKKASFRNFLQKFYTEIYIEESIDPKMFNRMKRRLRPIAFYSALYLIALLLFTSVGIFNMIQQRKEPLYKMTFAFDITPMWIYLPILLTNIWVGTLVVTQLIGEDSIIANVILHVEGRFKLLENDIKQRTIELLVRPDATHIARDFGAIIGDAVRETGRLHTFLEEFQREFTYRVFIMMSFSAALFCVLLFKVYTNPVGSFAYVFWISAKLLEMILIGELGSSLYVTTDQVSAIFYESNWEEILVRSTNRQENVRLMKLVLMAIGVTQKPFMLTGINFFSVSLTAIVKILQGAGSYFTCLIALR